MTMSMPGQDRSPRERMGAGGAPDPAPDANDGLLGVWRHSFEESDTTELFRPEEHDFPPARGRRAIEFRADGTFVDWAIAPGDGNEPRPGRWAPSGANAAAVRRADGRVVVARLVAPDLLELEEST